MEISQQGIDLLIAREGKHNEAYRDSKGIITIGVGHVSPDVHMGDVWTDERVEATFRKDLERFETALNESLQVEIPQHAYDALISWLFNVGADWARKATLMKRLNEGDMAGAAAGFDAWHIPPEITSRRNGEREQFKGREFAARIIDTGTSTA